MENVKTAGKPDYKSIPIIGVIGGVGPYAGLDFVRKIFNNTRAVRDQDHLNCMLVSCPSIVNDRTNFLLAPNDEEENPAYGMYESARRLHMADVKVACVACNTAHADRIFSHFLAMVAETLPGLQIVNMLETCALFAKKSLGIEKLGLLATKGTHKSRVYHEYFKEKDGFILMEPDEAGQENLHEAIFNKEFGIKAHSDVIKPQAKELIKGEIKKLAGQGAKGIILGCTELPLAVQNSDSSVPLIDPGFIAARKLIELVAPEKLLPYK